MSACRAIHENRGSTREVDFRVRFLLAKDLEYTSVDMQSTSGLLAWVTTYGYVAIFLILVLEELGVPIPLPGDLALLFVGYLVGRGMLRFDLSVATVVLAAVIGGSGLFLLTRRFGRPVIARYGRYVHLDHGRLSDLEARSRRFGFLAMLVARVTPGMRIYASALAGLAEVPYPRFLAALAFAALAWGLVFVFVGSKVGERWEELYALLEHHAVVGAMAVVLLLVLGAVAWWWRASWAGRAWRLLSKRSGRHQGCLKLPR